MDIPEFWRQTRSKQAQLLEKHPSGFLFVSPTNDPSKNTCGGDPVEVSTETAGRMIVSGTAREATEAEIETHRRHAREGQMIAQAQDLRNTGAMKVILTRAPEARR